MTSSVNHGLMTWQEIPPLWVKTKDTRIGAPVLLVRHVLQGLSVLGCTAHNGGHIAGATHITSGRHKLVLQ